MNTSIIFLVLVWIAATLIVFVGGLVLTVDYARVSDRKGVPALQGIGGTLLRLLFTLAATAGVIGIPLDVMGF